VYDEIYDGDWPPPPPEVKLDDSSEFDSSGLFKTTAEVGGSAAPEQ
jgi:hypothetical protein